MTKLPDETRIGAVELAAHDATAVTAFYRTLIGAPASAVRVVAASAPQPAFATGLYHAAFLHPSRRHLARAVRRLIQARWPIDGASDHLVSEAIYLSDPEGNGIEIYADRPKASWPRASDGALRMGTLPLDAQSLLDEPDPEDDAAPRVGHVHLKVADVPAAEAFYRDVVGFDVVASMGAQASFVSAGGYHHHVGMNSWASRGAPTPPAGAAGLRRFEVIVPDARAVDDAARRMDERKVEHSREGGAVSARDPSGNEIIIRLG